MPEVYAAGVAVSAPTKSDRITRENFVVAAILKATQEGLDPVGVKRRMLNALEHAKASLDPTGTYTPRIVPDPVKEAPIDPKDPVDPKDEQPADPSVPVDPSATIEDIHP